MPTEAETLTFLALLLPFAGAVFAPLLTRAFGHNAAWLLALVPALLFAHFASLVPLVAGGGRETGGIAWAPSLGALVLVVMFGASTALASGAASARSGAMSRAPTDDGPVGARFIAPSGVWSSECTPSVEASGEASRPWSRASACSVSAAEGGRVTVATRAWLVTSASSMRSPSDV